MSYSRRQLEAFGEPLGDSATRLKPGGNGRIYGGGGGGSAPANTQQTQIVELPEWARPYAQKILAKGEALTEGTTPATYGGQRYAGLSDLQKTAMGSVASPQAYGQAISGYMSPYMQNVVDIQKREAARQSSMLGAQQQAQATQAGAFGGYRDAIQRAERERNLGQQLNDIQERGSQSAYQAAEGAFGRNLQAQTQLGAMQQQDMQRPLDIAYQDFLNQQNYPYKQLGFMSDLLRGTPTGSSSAMSMYQAPGSMLGQLGGLGMGLYGMSRLMPGGFAEGGEVEGYAEGGEVEGYAEGGEVEGYKGGGDLSLYSDQDLQRAYQGALDRRDVELAMAIEKEMAEHRALRNAKQAEDASIAYGLGNAFDQIPEEDQERMMAGGGIVAFSKGGDEGEYFKDPMGAPDYQGGDLSLKKLFGQTVREGETYTPGLRGMLFGYNVLPREEKTVKASADVPYDRATATRLSDYKTETKAAPTSGGVKEAIKELSITHGLSEKTLMEQYNEMFSQLSNENKPLLDRLNKAVEKSSGRAERLRAEALPRALAEFGFQWAANAAKPGQARRAGLAGAIESAASAAPILAASAAESQKAIDKAEDAYTQLQMEQAKFELAMRKGDRATAMQHATNMRQLETSLRQLQLQAQQIAQTGAYQKGLLGIHGQDLGIKRDAAKTRGLSAAASMLGAQARVADVARKAGLDFDNSRQARDLMKNLTEQYGPEKAKYMYGQQRQAYILDTTQGIRDQVAQEGRVQNVFDLLGD
jgi:hypothetical protein